MWDGDKNKIPPYWGDLRMYVFRRDKYRCNKCHKVFRDEKKLDAHHVEWRENGGSDNPKNLVTVCEPCHDKIHGDTDTNSDQRREHTSKAIKTKNKIEQQDRKDSENLVLSGWIMPFVQSFIKKSTAQKLANKLSREAKKKERELKKTKKESKLKFESIDYSKGVFYDNHIFTRFTGLIVDYFHTTSLCNQISVEESKVKQGSGEQRVRTICPECRKIAHGKHLLYGFYGRSGRYSR